MAKYYATCTITYLKKTYLRCDPIEMEPKHAAPLLKNGKLSNKKVKALPKKKRSLGPQYYDEKNEVGKSKKGKAEKPKTEKPKVPVVTDPPEDPEDPEDDEDGTETDPKVDPKTDPKGKDKGK